MLRPELLTLYRSHADEDDSGFYSIHAVRDLFDHIDAQAERVAALEAAGDAISNALGEAMTGYSGPTAEVAEMQRRQNEWDVLMGREPEYDLG